MRKFTIIAHPTAATYPTIRHFVRTFTTESKALAIKAFFEEHGPFNYIDRIIEVKNDGSLY